MKNKLAVIITAIAVGSLATFAFASPTGEQDNSLKSTAALLGHITLTAYDEDGNIKNYRQTDNVVLDEGDDCIVEDLLGATGNCFATATTTNDFTFVHLGTGTTAMTEGSGLAQMTWDRQTSGSAGSVTAASGGGGASATVTANFFDVSETITEAALMNLAASNDADILALQDFADIPLGTTDDLTVQWTITVDGS